MSTWGAVNTISRGSCKWNNNNNFDNRFKAWFWNGGGWQAAPVRAWLNNSWTILNEGKYQTTWYANWSHSYRYLNKAESDGRHGQPRTYENGINKGHWYMYQGWWSSDPNGRMGSLFGFDMNSIRDHLSGATIEKVELYIRNIHSFSYGGDKLPKRPGTIYWHDYWGQPGSIKRTQAFRDDRRLGTYTYFRGASVQRRDAPVASALNWDTGYGTGLLDWTTHGGQTIEGWGTSKKVWMNLGNSVGEGFRDGWLCGFGLFDAQSSSNGAAYGYWCGANLSVSNYTQIDRENRANWFDWNISWQPQIRITYRKLNPS